MSRPRQGVSQAADDQAADQTRIPEPHLGLGRMHVDVQLARVELDKQGGGRMPVARQEVRVGRPERALQQPVAHRPAIDEKVLVGRVAPRIGRQAGVTREPHALALVPQQQGVLLELAPQHRGQPLQAALRARMFGRQAQHPATVDLQREAYRLVRHGLAADFLRDGKRFAALGLHELQPGRGGVEEVADLRPEAMLPGEGGRLRRPDQAAIDPDRPGLAGSPRPRRQGQAGYRPDRRQGLAPKPQGGDVQQVPVARVVRLQLGGGVSLDRQAQLPRPEPRAVIADQDAREAALLHLDLDAGRAGVDGVLNQLLDGARRPLDHLAGGDAVDGLLRQAADGHVG